MAITRATLILCVSLCALSGCATSGGPSASREEARRALTQFLTTSSALGQAELAFSRLAETKAEDPAVRAFATSLAAEQGPINDDLAAMARRTEIPIDTAMDARHTALYQQLQSEVGGGFDATYLQSQMQDRTMLIEAFQAQADSGADPQVRAYAQQHLPALMRDLHTALDLSRGR